MIENRSVEVLSVVENPDGSATVKFDFNASEVEAFFRLGVVDAIKRGIEKADELNPDAALRRNQTFEMTYDQIDALMIRELKDIYDRNKDGDKIDCSDDVLPPDYALLNACKILLGYIMPPNEFDKWKNSLQ